MQLYIVIYTNDDNSNLDWFVTAANALEAFVLWRKQLREDDFISEDGSPTSGTAEVFPAPVCAATPQLHSWDHSTSERFDMDMDTLATRAIEATLDI